MGFVLGWFKYILTFVSRRCDQFRARFFSTFTHARTRTRTTPRKSVTLSNVKGTRCTIPHTKFFFPVSMRERESTPWCVTKDQGLHLAATTTTTQGTSITVGRIKYPHGAPWTDCDFPRPISVLLHPRQNKQQSAAKETAVRHVPENELKMYFVDGRQAGIVCCVGS